MITRKVVNIILYNIILPILLLIVACARINIRHLVYLIFLLLQPQSTASIYDEFRVQRGDHQPKLFTLIIWIVSLLLIIVQFLFNILHITKLSFFASLPEKKCDFWNHILRQVGLEQWLEWDIKDMLYIVMPDMIIFLYTSILLFIMWYFPRRDNNIINQKIEKRISSGKSISNINLLNYSNGNENISNSTLRSIFMFNMIDKLLLRRKNDLKFLEKEKIKSIVHNILFTTILVILGCFHPTLLSVPYLFLSNIYILSWIFSKNLTFWHWSIGRRIFLLYTSVFILLHYCYQLETFNRHVVPESLVSRLLGYVVYQSPQDCINITRTEKVLNYFWPEYLSPLLAFLMYNIVTFQYIKMPYFEVIEMQIQNKKNQMNKIENHYDINMDENSHKISRVESSINETNNNNDMNKNKEISEAKKVRQVKKLMKEGLRHERDKKIIANIDTIISSSRICQFVTSYSYLITLFTMIAWSMLYRSWSTFILLAVACIIWISPNSKKSCLKISLYTGVYSLLLLIISYIYSLRLTEEELPEEHPSFLRQIGLEKPRDFLPCVHLYVKNLFTFLIFLSYRQKLIEYNGNFKGTMPFELEIFSINNIEEAGKNIHRKDTLGKAKNKISRVSSMIRDLPFKNDSFYKKIKKFFFQNVLIWIMILLLNTSINNNVVIYRIIYMVFFLVFINTFFITFTNWRRFLYLYLMSLIIFSACVLVMMYTYQFHGLPNLYEEYIGFTREVTESMGLRNYTPGQLIIAIMTPLSFLILALIQLNFFHASFMKRSEHWNKVMKLMRNPLVMPLRKIAKNFTITHGNSSINASKITEPSILEDQISIAESGYSQNIPPIDGKLESKGSHRYNKVKKMMTKMEKNIKTIYAQKTEFADVLWRFAEIHFDKALALILAYTIFTEISFLNIPFIIILIVFSPGHTYFDEAFKLCSVWSSVIIILKLIYQLPIINTSEFEVDCSIYRNNTLNITNDIGEENLLNILGVKKNITPVIETHITINPIDWIGLKKSDDLYNALKNYIFFLFMMALKFIVNIRQNLKRHHLKEDISFSSHLLFPGIIRRHADKNVKDCIKFLSNFFFYKFGFEITLISTAAVIAYRNDFGAFLHTIWLFPPIFIPRTRYQKISRYHTLFVGAFLIFQYVFCVGLPEISCNIYPWEDLTTNTRSRLNDWLNLPSIKYKTNAKKMFADFILYLLLCFLDRVFEEESKLGNNHPGGSNKPTVEVRGLTTIVKTLKNLKYEIKNMQEEDHLLEKTSKNKDGNQFNAPMEIPVPDFITEKGTLLDHFKEVLFIHFYWVTLAVLFLTGTSRVTLFALFYVLASFLFYWAGHSLFYLPIEYALKLFDLLIFYNNCVIFMRVILQAVGYLLIKFTDYDLCWFFQLNGIKYYNRNVEYSITGFENNYTDIGYNEACDQADNETGLFYDWLCFLFLVIQRRIFATEYFKHVIIEFKIQKVFASKGAKLIDEIRKNELDESKEFENEILNKVKFKMEKIKSRNIKENIMDNETNLNGNDDKEKASSVVVKKQSLSRHSSQGLEIEYDFDPPESPPHNKKKIQQRRKMSSPASIVKILDLGEKVSRRSSCTNISKHDVRELKKHSHMSKKRKKTSDSSSYGSSSSPIKSLEIFSVSDQKAKDDIKKLSSGEKRRKTMKRTFSINVDGPIYSFDQTDLKNIDDEECGVRGLGPLQLLNFAFKKGALKDAVKESNEIQATHDRLSKEMEDNYGISNYNLIRKAILKQKTKKVKPDFDECTFEEENDYALLGNRFSTSESVDDKKFSTVSMESGSRKVSIFGPKENVEGKEWEYIRRKTMIHLQKPSAEVGEGCISDVTSLISASDRNIFDDVGETFSVKLCDHPSNGNESPAILSELTQESFDEGEMLDKHYKKKNMSKIKYIKRRLRYFLISCKKTSKNLANFICLIAIGTIESIIAYLMFLSRDYRYVYKRLEKEKKVYRNKLNQKFSVTKNQYPMPSGNIPKIKVLISKSLSESPELSDENSKGTKDSSSLNDSDEYGYLNNSSKYKWREEYRLVRLVKAIYHLFLSRSETICYLMIFLNHMNNASLISMPLPLLALLWGTLTVPRPTKRFWTTIITYTEFLVIFKYLFQFGFFPWNNNLNVSNPFWIPRIIGIEKRKGYATYDLFLLMTLFFHRSTLITIGLWKGNNGNIEKRKKNVEEDKKSESIIDLRISKSDTQICGYNNERKENSVSVNFPTHFLDVKSLSSQSLKNKGTRALSKTLIVAQTKKATLHKKVKNELSSVQKFFKKLLDSSNRCSCDVFVPMFICDVICFLIIIFGFSGFGTGTGDGSVTAYLEQNKIPATLVSMLIIQFVLIIFDRAFFLRKFIFGKLIFQIFLVIFVHIWMFILLPAATERMFVNNLTCKLFYLTKVVYFLISAAQIRAGYPRRTLTNFGAHSYTALNLLLYKLFMLVPFLFELRSLMDWMWMDTSLGLGDWFSLHDIYSHIAMLKCERNIEEDYPSPKGVKKRPFHKYGLGGVYLVFMIFVIWFPLVLFSMANTVGVRSLPVECTLKLTVSGYQPLFESTAQLSDVRETTEEEYEKLLYIYRTSKYARNYLADYGKEDVVKTNVNGNSSMTWHISPPSREQLILDLQSNITIFLKFEWIFKRAYNDELQQFGEISDFNQIMLMPGDKIREKLTEMIIYKNSKTFDNNTTTVIEPILIEKAFPPMVVITGEGKAGPATSLLIEQLSDPYHNIQDAFFDVLLDLEHTKDGLEWWRLRMIDKNWDPIKKIEPTVKERTCIYAFVDKVFPKKFSIITGGGILGLYLSMVLFLGRFIRVQVTGAMEKIMFEELPNVDRVLQLCIDIFLVRDAGEFELEEDLYAKLVFLFRSPTTLIKWTKDKVL